MLLVLCFVLLACSQACGILASQPGTEPTPRALEGQVLTTGPPGKSPWIFSLLHSITGCYKILNKIPCVTESKSLLLIYVITCSSLYAQALSRV